MVDNSTPMIAPPEGFAGLPVCTGLDELTADIAVAGLHYKSPYPQPSSKSPTGGGAETAAEAIRRCSAAYEGYFDHFDFNLGRPLLADRGTRVVDCGDVPPSPGDAAGSARRITNAVRTILTRGALPLIFGTDEGGSCGRHS